jgi:hypothetical protein
MTTDAIARCRRGHWTNVWWACDLSGISAEYRINVICDREDNFPRAGAS